MLSGMHIYFYVFLQSGADETKQQTIINRESLELGKELGQGEFGSVLMGVWVDPIGERVSGNQFEHIQLSPCLLREKWSHNLILMVLNQSIAPIFLLVANFYLLGSSSFEDTS